MFPSVVRIKTEIDSLEYIYKKCRNRNICPPSIEELSNECGYTKQAFYQIPSIMYTLETLKNNKLKFDNVGFEGYYFDCDYIRLPLGLPDEVYQEFIKASNSEGVPILFNLYGRKTVKRKMLEIITVKIKDTVYKIFMLLDRTDGVLISTYWVSEVRMDSENVLCKVECHRFKAMVEFLKKCQENGWKVGAIDENSRFYK